MMNTLFDLFEKVCPNHNFAWKGSGDVGKGRCPFHDDRNPSMSIYRDDKSDRSGWYCHVCGFGGTEVDAVMRALNYNRKDANAWLVQQGYAVETEVDRRTRVKTEAFEAFRTYTNELLHNDQRDSAKAIRTYLVNRGVPMALWKDLAIGFYPSFSEVITWLNEKNIPESVHEMFLPGSADGKDFANGSIAFFYRSSFYAYSRIKVRNVAREKGAKDKSIQWLGPTKKKSEKVGFFAPGKIPTRSDKAVVVEGEFDAILMWNLCDKNEAIYSFGSGGDMDSGISALTSNGSSDEVIYVFPDNDDPGTKYLEDILAEYTMVSVFQPADYKDGEDPADWCKRHTFEDLCDAFENSIRGSEYVINKYVEALTKAGDDEDDKQRLQQSIVNYALKLGTQRILIEKLVDAVSPLLNCSKDALLNEITGRENREISVKMTRSEFGTYRNVSKDPRKPQWEKVANIVVRGVKAIKEQLAPIDERKGEGADADAYGTTYFVFKVSTPEFTHTLKLPHTVVSDDRKFAEALLRIVGMEVVDRNNIGWIRKAAIEFKDQEKSKAVSGEVIKKFCGWEERGKTFLAPGGYIDSEGFHSSKESGVYVNIARDTSDDGRESAGIYNQFFLKPAPADMDFVKRLIREDLINIYPHYVTLPLLAHAFSAPLLGIYNIDKFAFWLYGRTGKGKSTFASILASFYGNFWEKRNGNSGPVTWSSTPYSIELIGGPLYNMLYLVDDFKTGRTSTHSSIEGIRTILQSYADNTGKYRQGASQRINGLLLCTGEDLPLNESSLKGRSLVIQLTEGGDRFKAENFYANHCIHLPGVMAGFIQFLINKKLTERDVLNHTLKWKKRIAKLIEGLDSESHSRTENNLTLNACAWEYLAEYLGLEDLTDEYIAAITRIAKYMSNFQEEDDPCKDFLNIILDQIATGRCFLAGKAGPNSAIGESSRGSQIQVGEVHENHVILYSSVAQNMVNSVYRGINGAGFPHSFRSLASMMDDKGWLIKKGKEGAGNRRTVKVKGNERGYCLRRDLFEMNTTIDDDESTQIVRANPGGTNNDAEDEGNT